MNNKIETTNKKIELNDADEYYDDVLKVFDELPVVAKPLVIEAKKSFNAIEKQLYSAPAFIELVKASIPQLTYQAILTYEQKRKIANGALKLMTKKNGELLADLVNPKTNVCVSKITLEKVNLSPSLSNAITSYSAQMQMAEIAEEIQNVQLAIEEVRQGQVNDRLALAYSCQQKLLQTIQIKNIALRKKALLKLAFDAEDCRNKLMLNQKEDISFINNQPENTLRKLFNGADKDDINRHIKDIRDGLAAINNASLIEAVAYQELGEMLSAKQSLKYYAGYLQETILSNKNLIQRLYLIDSKHDQYWLEVLPEIRNKVNALTSAQTKSLLKGGNNVK